MYDDHLFRVSLKAIIRRPGGEVLVVKENGRTDWDLPGGGMEHGETFESGLERELKEEISFTGSIHARLVGSGEPGKLKSRDVWQARLYFIVTTDATDFTPGPDAHDLTWVKPNFFLKSGRYRDRHIHGLLSQ